MSGTIMGHFRSAEVRQLLHNKFVVVLGDSIQRSVYKDLVKLLRGDNFLTEAQLKRKGEMSFENDALVEGGSLNEMTNEITFREVRQYRTGHHLVRFYFLTRVYSSYLESVLSDFQRGPQPDVVMVNSCVWDLMRYDDHHLEVYKTNLDNLFQRLKEVLSPQCLIIWNMTMPVGFRDNEIPENTVHNLRMDIAEGNFFSATLADFHKLDVLDMHYHFRCNLRLRCRDAVHWNPVAHRKYSQILLTHIARAWGVEMPKGKMAEGSTAHSIPTKSVAKKPDAKLRPPLQERHLCSQEPLYMPGYTSFGGSEVDAIPGVRNPENHNNENINPDDPPITSHSFAVRNLLFPNQPPPMKLPWFPHHAQNSTNMKKKSGRRLKPPGGWTHPYR
ncbi:hypothetical protein GDO81_028331 [Engystomops pustulosus]|uniref:PC-esterase domain-containing protein 1A n=1 Tax=Engystomops pustulosus TaxID=76066 RepID=A0AAV6ZJB0_ENGPU|nr:hypothetical protein GDO81_028331 [Engystomops pustulosus]